MKNSIVWRECCHKSRSMDCFYCPPILVFWQMNFFVIWQLPIHFIGQHINIFSLVLPRNPLTLILNHNIFHLYLCLVSYEQKTNYQWKFLSYYFLFSPFFLPQNNRNSLFSSVVPETKIKIVLTILIAISCSADITRLPYLLLLRKAQVALSGLSWNAVNFCFSCTCIFCF